MSATIDDSIRRTQAYWFVDGLVELCMGVLFIFLGIVLLIEGPAPSGSDLAVAMSAIRYLVIFGGTIGIGIALRHFKGHLTYPRSGYVIYRKSDFKGMSPGFFAIVILCLLLEAWVQAAMPEKLFLFIFLMAGLAVFFAYLYISWGNDTGFRRFYMLAALTITAGLVQGGLGVIFILRENTIWMLLGSGLFFAMVGVGTCLSGAVALRQYLQQTEPQALDGGAV